MKKSTEICDILFYPMTMTLTQPNTSENKILENINDGLNLALTLHKAADESENRTDQRHNLKYLGTCLRTLKDTIDIGTASTTQEP